MSDADNPGSGAGCTLTATQEIRRALPDALRWYSVETLLDVGCGDFTWMKETELPCRYIGMDIVPDVLAENERLYANDQRRFVLGDAVSEELPDADAVLFREILFHLSFEDARAALLNALSKPRRYIFATTDRSTLFNADILSGDYRVLNLERGPFRLPPPRWKINDSKLVEGRLIGVWSADDVRQALTG